MKANQEAESLHFGMVALSSDLLSCSRKLKIADVLHLLHAAHWSRNQGATDIEADSWGDDPQVLAQYQRVGFENIRQHIIHRLSCQ